MLPFYQNLPYERNLGFDTFVINHPAHNYPFHYHPEVELCLFGQYSGEVIIGQKSYTPRAGELLYIAPGIPHANPGHPVYEGIADHATLVIFRPLLADGQLLTLPELYPIGNMIASKNKAYVFGAAVVQRSMAPLFRHITKVQGADRYIILLQIIASIFKNFNEALVIDPGGYKQLTNQSVISRVDAIYRYIHQHFHETISLEAIANEVHMQRESVSRFFREKTGRNISDIVTSVRLERVCSLLRTTDKSVGAISYECGFNNLANFNKQFRIRYDCSPVEFRKRMIN